MMPWLSIITVVKDDPAGLAVTAASLSGGAAAADVEWIVCDGGADADAWGGTQATLAAIDTPVPIIDRAADDGPYDGMNRGLERARGRYALFLNAGDSLAAVDTLERVSDWLHYHPEADLALFDALEIPAAGQAARYKPARRPEQRLWGMPTHHQAMIFRTDLIRALGGYGTAYRIAADYDLYLRAWRHRAQIERAGLPLCRFAPAGLSAREAALGRREQVAIRRKVMGLDPLSNMVIGAAQGLALNLRQRLPGLYGRLRYAGHAERSGGGNAA